MLRLRLFLDTNVPTDVASGAIPPARWGAAQRRILREFDYVISPITLIELFNGIEGGDDEHFSANRTRLERLVEPAAAAPILALPAKFLLETAYSATPPEALVNPEVLRMCLRCVLAAHDRPELQEGIWLPGMETDERFVVDLPKNREKVSEAKQQHVERLERIRLEGHEAPDGRWWAGAMVREAGQPVVTPQDCDRALEALDAAYRYDAQLFREVRGLYRIAAKDSDYMDIHQLLYLCDPGMRILTRDRVMMRRVAGSPQAPQLIDFDHFA